MTNARSKIIMMTVVSIMATASVGGFATPGEANPEMKMSGAEAPKHGGMMMTGDAKKDTKMMHDMMMKELGPKDADYEDRFIDLMIPHHEAAIMMAKDAIEKTNKPELKKMAQEIIAAQEKEIKQMKEWRKKWYGH